MTTPKRRRPLPALVLLLALCVLAALVWWRVLNRDGTSADASPSCRPSAPSTVAGQLPNPASVRVLVLNSTDRSGLAGTARTALVTAGFAAPDPAGNDAVQYGGNGKAIAGVAEVRYGPAAEAGARLLAYYLPGAKLVERDTEGSTVVVALGEKFDKIATKDAVLARLAADRLTMAPPPARPSGTASPSPGAGSGKTSTPGASASPSC